MQFVYALSVLLALTTVNAYQYASKDYETFNIESVLGDLEKLKALNGCLIETAPCSELAAEFRRDMPDAFETACKNCDDRQRGILFAYLEGLKNKLPEEHKAFINKYDNEGKYSAKLYATIGH